MMGQKIENLYLGSNSTIIFEFRFINFVAADDIRTENAIIDEFRFIDVVECSHIDMLIRKGGLCCMSQLQPIKIPSFWRAGRFSDFCCNFTYTS